MKISASQYHSFVKAIPASIKAILLYGPDQGLSLIRSREIIQKIIPKDKIDYSLTKLLFDEIKNDPEKFAETLHSMSFFGGRRVVLVEQAPNTVGEAILSLTASNISDTLVIITAGDLPPASSLRKYFEKEKHTAVIPCYKDDSSTIRQVISAELKKDGYSIEIEALTYLENALVGDRMLILSEIEKMKLYKADSKQITVGDAMDLSSGAIESNMDEFCIAVAANNKQKAHMLLERLYSEGVNAISIIRALSRYYNQLYFVKARAVSGDIRSAMMELKPPVFFKYQDSFLANVRSKTLANLSQTLALLLDVEAKCKKGIVSQQLLCDHLITELV